MCLNKRICKVLLTMMLVLATLRWGITPKMVLMFGFICILYWLSIVDIQKQEIPDRCHLIAIGMRFLYYFIFEGRQLDGFLYLIASGFSVALPLLILTMLMEKIRKMEVMGGGDIKLLFVTGLYLGWETNLCMLLVACILGIIIYFVQENRTMQEEPEETYFPFGPEIAIATVVCFLIREL